MATAHIKLNQGVKVGACLLGLSLANCKSSSDEEWQGPPPDTRSPQVAPQASSPDRLPPGKLLEGPERVYGFAVPKGMELKRTTRDQVRITGNVKFDELTDYVKDRIAVRHAEMIGRKLEFPNARIRGNSQGVYRLTLSTKGKKTVLVIQDKTRPPGTGGLTEKQRWERVGLRPSGGLVDPNQME